MKTKNKSEFLLSIESDTMIWFFRRTRLRTLVWCKRSASAIELVLRLNKRTKPSEQPNMTVEDADNVVDSTPTIVDCSRPTQLWQKYDSRSIDFSSARPFLSFHSPITSWLFLTIPPSFLANGFVAVNKRSLAVKWEREKKIENFKEKSRPNLWNFLYLQVYENDRIRVTIGNALLSESSWVIFFWTTS